MARTLTPKQKMFVAEYLVDLNATQAAIRAGYSKRSADKIGAELLGKTVVSGAIQKAIAKRKARTEITQDRVLKELARVGFSDLRQVFGEDGRLLRPEQWSEDIAASVASVDVVTRNIGDGEVEYVYKLRLWDKNSALEKIAKHLGMFIERHEHSGPGGGPIQSTEITPEQARELAKARGLPTRIFDE